MGAAVVGGVCIGVACDGAEAFFVAEELVRAGGAVPGQGDLVVVGGGVEVDRGIDVAEGHIHGLEGVNATCAVEVVFGGHAFALHRAGFKELVDFGRGEVRVGLEHQGHGSGHVCGCHGGAATHFITSSEVAQGDDAFAGTHQIGFDVSHLGSAVGAIGVVAPRHGTDTRFVQFVVVDVDSAHTDVGGVAGVDGFVRVVPG